MRRSVRLSALLALVSAATAFAALAFANNVVAVARWWAAFRAAGGDTSGLPARAAGFLPWLDWTAVDSSAVTTLIPLMGFAFMLRALVRLLRGKPFPAEDFPFFRGSDQVNVALGLFGTLWGIIVIGYFKLDTVTMADLMQCLHTALFSTLAAVVWVFLLDRPLIRPFFRRLLDESGLAESDDGDLAAAVDRLVLRLGAASDAFERRQRAFEETSERRAREYADAFERRERAYEESFEKRLSDYEKEAEARRRECVEVFQRRIGELEGRVKEAESRAAASEGRLRAVCEALKA